MERSTKPYRFPMNAGSHAGAGIASVRIFSAGATGFTIVMFSSDPSGLAGSKGIAQTFGMTF